MHYQINPAFISESTEYFQTPHGRAHGITNGQTHEFDESPKSAIKSIRKEITKLPKGIGTALKVLAQKNGLSEEEQAAYCLLGKTDNLPDVCHTTGKVNLNEAAGCPLLATCTSATKICLAVKALMTPFTKAELRVASQFPASAPEIAETLSLSTQTVYKHEQNMRESAGVDTRDKLIYYTLKAAII